MMNLTSEPGEEQERQPRGQLLDLRQEAAVPDRLGAGQVPRQAQCLLRPTRPRHIRRGSFPAASYLPVQADPEGRGPELS